MKQRINWIDLLRGICMLAILLDHTELYYTGINIIDYNFYVVNALTIFFFLSGYLMFKKSGFHLHYKLIKIVRSLLIPYLTFTFIIALPKALIRHSEINFSSICIHILCGKESWFIAALFIAEIIFSIILWISHEKIIYILILSIAAFLISIQIPTPHEPFFWQWDNALQATFFLSLGYLYHRYENKLEFSNRISYNFLFFLLLIILKVYEYQNQISLIVNSMNISSYPLFITDTLISIFVMTNLSKILPHCKIIEWTGQRSIVYYFFCGGVPLIISILLDHVNFRYMGDYLHVIFVFILVYLLTSFIAWIVFKYTPFLVGRKTLT